MIIPSWDDEGSYVHDLAPTRVDSVTVHEAEYDDEIDTGLLDHRGQPIMRRAVSPKAKLGFWLGY